MHALCTLRGDMRAEIIQKLNKIEEHHLTLPNREPAYIFRLTFYLAFFKKHHVLIAVSRNDVLDLLLPPSIISPCVYFTRALSGAGVLILLLIVLAFLPRPGPVSRFRLCRAPSLPPPPSPTSTLQELSPASSNAGMHRSTSASTSRTFASVTFRKPSRASSFA